MNTQILTTKANLKLLLGKDIGYDFPLAFPKSKDPKKATKTKPEVLQTIIDNTPEFRAKSFDERFDKKHHIEIAINQLQDKGFTKEIVYKILKNRASVKSKQIKGTYLYLTNFITDAYKSEIVGKLKEVTIDQYGNFRRGGAIF